MRVPAALIALPLTAGSLTGLLTADLAPPFSSLLSAGAAALALLSALALLGDEQSECCASAIVCGALLAGVSLGWSAAIRAYEPPLLAWFLSTGHAVEGPIVLHGTLREDAAATASGVSLVVDVDGVEGFGGMTGGVRLSVLGELASVAMGEWRKGRTLSVTAALRQPAVYRNPGVPDERRALARRGITLVGSVKSAAMVTVLVSGNRIDEWASASRVWVRAVLARAVAPWSPRSAGVSAAIAIGDRNALGHEDERRLQDAGTYHVVAISGGNIAILAVLLLGILRVLRVPSRIASGLAIAGLLFYGQVTGPAPSVDRAIGAAVIFLAARLIDLPAAAMNILAIAAIAAIAAAPTAVLDPGFILSFGATLAILIGVPRLTRTASDRSRPTLAKRLAILAAGVLVATVSIELVLAPISAALFGRVTFAGLLLNFVAIPLMTVVQCASMMVLAVFAFSQDAARWAGGAVHFAARGLVDSSKLVDVAPWLVRDVAPPSWSLLVLYYGALAGAMLRTRMTTACAAVALGLGIVIVAAPHAMSRDGVDHPPPGWLRIVFLDVGQGDSTLIVLPDRRAFLVDAGGLPPAPLQDPDEGSAFDIGERVVARAIRAFGVRRLDTFVLTHGDPDHVGGARTILHRFLPRAIWDGVPVPPLVPLQSLSTLAAGRGMEWRTVMPGDRLKIAGVEVSVWHPPAPEWERQRVRNDDSVVLAVRYKDVTVVLPGDIGREGESRLLERVERTPVVVLKAPHHGSATSSTAELLAALRPAAVVFSAGRDNRFGHPHPAVVARYRKAGVEMFSTARHGAVILETDGVTAAIRPFDQPEPRLLTPSHSASISSSVASCTERPRAANACSSSWNREVNF